MPTLDGIPLELLQIIASNLSQRDIGAFVRSNRHFYISLISYLYQHNKKHHRGSALVWGVQENRVDTVQRSIQEYFHLDIIFPDSPAGYYIHRDSYGYDYYLTPLDSAIRSCHYRMVRLLIENGAGVNQTHITRASRYSCHAYMQECINYEIFSVSTAKAKLQALRAALQMGHSELVDLVSKDRADVPSLYREALDIIDEAVKRCKQNTLPIVKLLLDKGAELRWSVYEPSDSRIMTCDAILRPILERWRLVSPTGRSFTPNAVCDAAFYGNKPLLNLFLEMGASPNCVGTSQNWVGTPLMAAAHSGQFKMVKFLVEKRADANLTIEPVTTSLSMACYSTSAPLRERVPPWLQDIEEKTKIIDYLLELGVK
jgi:hypothetical protein